jgi:hypothetical protein
MNIHHFVSSSATLSCLGVGYGYVYIGLLTTLMEYSTLPVNYRSLYTYEEVVGDIGNVTNLSFFGLYTIFRIILLPYVSYKIWQTVGFITPYIGPITKVFMWYGLILFLFLMILSYYWYIGILKVVAKSLGLIKRSGEKKADDLSPWRKIGNIVKMNKIK